MKKFIAFANNSNSGIVSKDAAHKWAAKHLAERPALQAVHIAEVIETAERTTPTIETKQFFVQLDEPTAKVA